MLRHHIANLKHRVSEYQGNDNINEGLNIKNDDVSIGNDGVKQLNKTLLKIYQAIVNKPEIRYSELMKILNISESTVTRSTREL